MLSNRRITKKARYPETTEGHARGLLRIRKCTCEGYLQENPFFQTERMGFLFLNKRIRLSKHHLSKTVPYDR